MFGNVQIICGIIPSLPHHRHQQHQFQNLCQHKHCPHQHHHRHYQQQHSQQLCYYSMKCCCHEQQQ